jgi:predicted DNA-binding transcriptional regulator AlpA
MKRPEFRATDRAVAPTAPQNDLETVRSVVPIHDRLAWDLDEISVLTSLSRRTLERLRAGGKFPRPDLTVGRRVLWRPETVRRWIEGGGRP